MARATYIYLVKKFPSRHVIGVFTVKHEMITGIERNLSEHETIGVWRYADGMLNNALLMAEGPAKKVLEELR